MLQTPDHGSKSATDKDKSPGSAAQTPSRDHGGKTSSKSTTPTNGKPPEKQRKKRSRSLFTRKNKLRDSEVDSELAVDLQGEYNYYYPAMNMNALNASSGSEDSGRREYLLPPGPDRRQYGRQGHPNHVSNTSDEVIV